MRAADRVRALRSPFVVVLDGQHLQLLVAARRPHRDDVADPVPEEGTGERRHERDQARRGVGFVDADDLNLTNAAVARAHPHPGAEPHLVAVCGRRSEYGRRDPYLQLGPASGDGVVVRPRREGIERGQLFAKRPEAASRLARPYSSFCSRNLILNSRIRTGTATLPFSPGLKRHDLAAAMAASVRPWPSPLTTWI
jgi:hypothetical protein